jgi:hypothetical protein
MKGRKICYPCQSKRIKDLRDHKIMSGVLRTTDTHKDNKTARQQEYREYLSTDHWRELAEETKRLAGYRCQVCNSTEHLQAHHRTYERKGKELQSDLVCLCDSCHNLYHKKNEVSRLLDLGIDENYIEQLAQSRQQAAYFMRKIKTITGVVLSYRRDLFDPLVYERLSNLLDLQDAS